MYGTAKVPCDDKCEWSGHKRNALNDYGPMVYRYGFPSMQPILVLSMTMTACLLDQTAVQRSLLRAATGLHQTNLCYPRDGSDTTRPGEKWHFFAASCGLSFLQQTADLANSVFYDRIAHRALLTPGPTGRDSCFQRKINLIVWGQLLYARIIPISESVHLKVLFAGSWEKTFLRRDRNALL